MQNAHAKATFTAVALGLFLLSVAFTGTAAAQSEPNCGSVGYSGSGTSGDPYQVGNLSQLQCMNQSLGANYTQTSDIDTTPTSTWNGGAGFDPIGDSGTKFTGTFDGEGYNITGLTVNRSSTSYIGLFGYVDGGTVSNTSVVGADVNGSDYVGGLVGYNAGTLRSSHAAGNVTGTSSWYTRVGGVAGFNTGTIRRSSAAGVVSAPNSGDSAGGITGYNSGGTVDSSYATATVSADIVVGGLIGYNAGTLLDSNATGDVRGSGTVGGLAGQNSDLIESSYSTGDVSAAGAENVGGLVGYNYGGVMTDSYATGDVTGSTDVGGLVGEDWDGSGGVTVNTSYATGSVSGSTNVGGFVGYDNGGKVTYSYWDVNTTNQTTSSGNATGLTTSEMKGSAAKTNMGGFDFTNTWDVLTTPVSYPFLRNNTQTPAPGSEGLYAGGDGTESDPYQISDWYHLNNTRHNLGANFTVVNDLNETSEGYDDVANASANAGKGFVPIGGSLTHFTGTFDGAGYDITGLTIDRPSEGDVGLFGNVNGSTVTNTSVVDADITGYSAVGALVGYNNGTVRDSDATGSLSSTYYVGGLVGYNDNGGTVDSSYATGSVSSTSDYVGGLVGFSDGAVNTSYATGSVSSGGNNVGGLVGYNHGPVGSSYATGKVKGSQYVGGLVGYNFATVDSSYATGNVSGGSDVGGLVGYDIVTVSNSYWDVNTSNQSSSDGGTGLTTPEMTGGGAPVNMVGFDFTGTWYATEGYPVLVWQGAGPLFDVNITGTNSPVDETETLEVTVNVTNNGGNGTRVINLTVGGTQRDSTSLTLSSGASQEFNLTWATTSGDAGTYTAIVSSADASARTAIDVQASGGGGGSDSGVVSSEPNDPPSANVVITPSPPVVGETTTFDASGSSDTDGSINEYRWEIDGTSYSGETVDITFQEAGANHYLELTVIDDNSDTDTINKNFEVVESTDETSKDTNSETSDEETTNDDSQDETEQVEQPDDEDTDNGDGTADDEDNIPVVPVVVVLSALLIVGVGYWYTR